MFAQVGGNDPCLGHDIDAETGEHREEGCVSKDVESREVRGTNLLGDDLVAAGAAHHTAAHAGATSRGAFVVSAGAPAHAIAVVVARLVVMVPAHGA